MSVLAFLKAFGVLQETRTLWTNNVEDGVWRGPAQLPTTCPPQPQFVTGMPAPKQIEY